MQMGCKSWFCFLNDRISSTKIASATTDDNVQWDLELKLLESEHKAFLIKRKAFLEMGKEKKLLETDNKILKAILLGEEAEEEDEIPDYEFTDKDFDQDDQDDQDDPINLSDSEDFSPTSKLAKNLGELNTQD